MKRSEIKLRSIIREHIQKSLITEKFGSQEARDLNARIKRNESRWGMSMMAKLSKQHGIAWDLVDGSAFGKSPSSDSNVINFFFVDKYKENPFAGKSWDTTISAGLIGVTIGKTLAGFDGSRFSKGRTLGKVSKASARAGSQTAGLHNFKRYSEVADTVITVDISKVKGTVGDKVHNRAQAKKGATALMANKDVVNQNMKRYKKALQNKIMDKGPDELKRLLDEATALTEKVFRFTTDMLKQGMYSTGWDSYQTISNNYGNMVRAYENYVRDAAQFEKEKKDDKNFDSWRRDYVAGRAGEVKGYYTELVKKAKIVMNKDNYKPIAK
tara:strand:- start:28 stop:1005 length:978 start_codon:yes stop_codon:yes gene_type:complete